MDVSGHLLAPSGGIQRTLDTNAVRLVISSHLLFLSSIFYTTHLVAVTIFGNQDKHPEHGIADFCFWPSEWFSTTGNQVDY